MIQQVCAHIHNFFLSRNGVAHHRESGTFTISEGSIDLPFLMDGQYFLITGSRFSDGVHKYPVEGLTDETFTGIIWEMRPPKDFLDLVDEIDNWNTKYASVMNSPYSSESFNGYSYQKAQSYASNGGGGFLTSWQTVFSSRLNQWRKLA
jgi:hypothetical protein